MVYMHEFNMKYMIAWWLCLCLRGGRMWVILFHV